MPPEDTPQEMRGIEMDDGEVEEALAELGHGTLSLVRGGEAYGVPVSFGYDGERIFLYLIQFGEGGRKFDFLETTETASLTAYAAESKFVWRSVVVDGPLADVTDEEVEYMESVMDDNAWFPGMYPPTDPVTGVRRMELVIETASGRMGVEYR